MGFFREGMALSFYDYAAKRCLVRSLSDLREKDIKTNRIRQKTTIPCQPFVNSACSAPLLPYLGGGLIGRKIVECSE